jgi:hypothetical protein|tara:strand:- start:176 stop:328 length:153 start_codon:yes stop_codon:yes gene_type:complete
MLKGLPGMAIVKMGKQMEKEHWYFTWKGKSCTNLMVLLIRKREIRVSKEL